MVRGSTTQTTAVSDSDLAVLLRQTQWTLDEAAYDFPAGRCTPQRREELAGSLEALARIVRASTPAAIAQAPVQLPAPVPTGGMHLLAADTGGRGDRRVRRRAGAAKSAAARPASGGEVSTAVPTSVGARPASGTGVAW